MNAEPDLAPPLSRRQAAARLTRGAHAALGLLLISVWAVLLLLPAMALGLSWFAGVL